MRLMQLAAKDEQEDMRSKRMQRHFKNTFIDANQYQPRAIKTNGKKKLKRMGARNASIIGSIDSTIS